MDRKKIVFVDMDNVLVDFESGLAQVSESVKKEYEGREDEIPGLFGLMKPMPGAIEAMHELQNYYDLFILSTAPWKNPSAWSDKVKWVTKYLDDVFHKRMVITHRKDLCQGDYLIDDLGRNGTSEFKGEWIQFGSEKFPNWESVLAHLGVATEHKLPLLLEKKIGENLSADSVLGYRYSSGYWKEDDDYVDYPDRNFIDDPQIQVYVVEDGKDDLICFRKTEEIPHTGAFEELHQWLAKKIISKDGHQEGLFGVMKRDGKYLVEVGRSVDCLPKISIEMTRTVVEPILPVGFIFAGLKNGTYKWERQGENGSKNIYCTLSAMVAKEDHYFTHEFEVWYDKENFLNKERCPVSELDLVCREIARVLSTNNFDF